MRLDAIAILLNQAIGLDAGSIGRSVLERAVRQRVEACGLGDAGEYVAHVSASRGELRELIEAVVVPETWFFRDRAAFTALGRLARGVDGKSEDSTRTERGSPDPQRLEQSISAGTIPSLPPSRHAAGLETRVPLRLLSIPCATGEEPYSMAMALLDSGVPAARIQIEAADISARSLVKARRAVYGSNSFRGDALDFRDRYFEKSPAGHRIVPEVRRLVSFRQGNLVPGEFPEDRAPYDFIFCRNALIYFDARTQQAVLGLLRRLLKPQGVLFVGPAESGRMTDGGFASAQIPKAFAFRAVFIQPTPAPLTVTNPLTSRGYLHEYRGGDGSSPQPLPRTGRSGDEPSPPRRRGAMPGATRVHESLATRAAENFAEMLRLARELADRARLPEAAALCESLLADHLANADVLCLFGLVRDAEGDAEAARELYRKALYLDPHHAEALAHLALLNGQSGQHEAARLLHRRAARVREKLQP